MANPARVRTDTGTWVDLATATVDLSQYPNMTTTPISGFRNAIINGDFRIWQRGTSFTGNGNYTADRWQLAFGGTGTATTTSQVAFTVGNAISGYESQYHIRNAVTGGSGTGSLSVLTQKIEDVRSFAGQTVTLSFWAKATSGTPYLGLDLYQEFGSGGSTTVGGIGATKFTLSTSWTRFTTTITIPSISGKTVGAGSLLATRFWFSSGSDYNSLNGSMGIQSNTFDIWGVQLEKGSIATPFEQRPIGTELALCQRYYYLHASNAGEQIGTCILNSASEGICIVKFPVTMRIAPTSATTSGTNFYATFFNNTQYTFNSLNIFGSGVNSAGFFWTQTSLTVGWGGRLQIPSSGGGMVAFVAEL